MPTKQEIIGANSANLIKAYTEDKFADFMALLAASGHSLAWGDFTAKTLNENGRAVTVGQFIADYARPERILQPALWAGKQSWLRVLELRRSPNKSREVRFRDHA